VTTLLTFRENVKGFFGRYDFVITPILKFILAFIVFHTLDVGFGYWAILGNPIVILMLSAICAFLPSEVITAIGGVIIVMESFKVSIDVGVLAVAMIIIFYCGYMRFVPQTGIIVLLVPILNTIHLTYALPILLGFIVGPAAIVPAIFGLLLDYCEGSLSDIVKVMAASTEEDTAVSGYQYVINGFVTNKELLYSFVVMAFVILVTYCIYRLSFEHAWIISFVVGGILNITLFLIGNVLVLINVDILPIVYGTIIGIVIAVIVQFCKGIVDYQRTELLQFEDDEYYYYVKAIPKMSISGSNKNIKHINSKS